MWTRPMQFSVRVDWLSDTLKGFVEGPRDPHDTSDLPRIRPCVFRLAKFSTNAGLTLILQPEVYYTLLSCIFPGLAAERGGHAAIAHHCLMATGSATYRRPICGEGPAVIGDEWRASPARSATQAPGLGRLRRAPSSLLCSRTGTRPVPLW